jgi:cell division ATPase MinD
VGRIITISSGKGGVGKTTLCANLAAALSELGKSVIVVDANLSTSNLGLHLGIPLYPNTLQDVLKGKIRIKDAIYHHPAGFKIIPADVSVRKLMVPKKSELVDVFLNLAESADFVLIDSAAGLGAEARSAIEAAEEMIAVTNPEMPALTDALKLVTLADRYATGIIGVVVNRVRKEKHEVSLEDVGNFLELPVLGVIKEDRRVREAIAKKMPVLLHKPRASSSKQIRQIAEKLAGEERRKGFWERLFGQVD